MHQPLDLSIQATNLMSRATLERKMEEVRNERLKVESFKNQANRKIIATRQQVHDLKAEETRLRHEEGLLSDRASDLHELVQQSTAKAEQLELEIIGLEKQIPDIDPTA